MNLSSRSEISFVLYDFLGSELVQAGSEMHEPGTMYKTLNLDNYELENGVYLLRVNIDGKPHYVRLVKRH